MDVRPLNMGQNVEEFYLNKIQSPNLAHLDSKETPPVEEQGPNRSSSPRSGHVDHTKTLLDREEELRMRLKASHAQ